MPPLTVLNNRPAGNAAGGGISGIGGPIRDATRARISQGLIELLRSGGGPDGRGGEVRFGAHDRLLYSTDASLYQVEPIGVVVPASIADAQRVVRFCAANGVAMLPRGGGTSLAGQCTNHAVVIDFTGACRAVSSLDINAKSVEVEPGIGIDELNDALTKAGSGLFFAPDPATTRQCAIGGAIGNNAAGARSVLYGRTSENLISIDAMLATGERVRLGPGAGVHDPVARRLASGVLDITRKHAHLIRERFPRTIRRNAGYALDMVLDQIDGRHGAVATPETVDLSKLLCGSEGTLAVTLGAKLRLHSLPKSRGLAVVAFANVEDAINATQLILKTGPSAVELLDDVVLEAARGNAECRGYLQLVPKVGGKDADAILYVEYFAFSNDPEEIRAKFKALESVVPGAPIAAFADAPSMNKLWLLRKAGEPLLHGLPGARKPITFVEDNAVPVERLGEFVREFKQIVARHGTKAAYWAHASVGVLHVRPMINLHDPEDRKRMQSIAVEVADLARACGGIMSGEHGDGRVRGPLLERFFGPELMDAFREVKRLFDPHNLLNPGNIVTPGSVSSIAENLRIDAQGVDLEHGPSRVETYFDYANSQGFGHAVEQCNGAGVCRKRTGVMCPSYQATLDERHSTRGRGNALRLSITGQFAASSGVVGQSPNWNDPETIETLDLCLSCKACKSECPSNVDIARLKAEYTAQRFKAIGSTFKAKLFGHVRVLNRLGSLTPSIANRVNRLPPAKWLLRAALGFAPRRSVPEFATSLLAQAAKDREITAAMHRPGSPRVVLFADCFTTYNDPRIGLAALRVLARLGYEVAILPGTEGAWTGCCGRALISTGLLDEAVESADRTLKMLLPMSMDARTVAVVACEPSCLSAIKDDWLELKLRTSKQRRVALAAKSFLVEEFVDRAWDDHPTRPSIDSHGVEHVPTALLHGHCHQKALWGADTSMRLLKRLLGDRVKLIESTCCGMAGSFGYAEDRYELSMKIGELGVLPAVRSADKTTVVCAPGTSCRHQIHDGAGRNAVHPIELAEMLIRPVVGERQSVF